VICYAFDVYLGYLGRHEGCLAPDFGKWISCRRVRADLSLVTPHHAAAVIVHKVPCTVQVQEEENTLLTQAGSWYWFGLAGSRQGQLTTDQPIE
jgi:hypothetical protein